MPDKNFQTSFQLIIAGSASDTPHHETILSLEDTSVNLIDNGFPALQLVVKDRTIDKAPYDHGIT